MSTAEDTQFAFCSAPTPRHVYAGPARKCDFDRIALPVTVHEWKADKTENVLRGDGREYETRLHTKDLRHADSGVMVIFQWRECREAQKAVA